MTTELQIEALLELEGWKRKPVGLNGAGSAGWYPPGLHPMTNINQEFTVPDYLFNHAAIATVVSHRVTDWDRFSSILGGVYFGGIYTAQKVGEIAMVCFLAHPGQIAEALLRYEGKWVASPPNPAAR